MLRSSWLARLAVLVWLAWLALVGMMLGLLWLRVWHPHFLPIAMMDAHVKELESRLGRTSTRQVYWVRGPVLGLRARSSTRCALAAGRTRALPNPRDWPPATGTRLPTSCNPTCDNVIQAADGNDVICANSFINTIRGEGGKDTAVFRGRSSQYTVTATTYDGSAVVVQRRGPASSTHVTTLIAVERIRFSQRGRND